MIRDLALGIRLAVGGGRLSGALLLRLAMTALGIGLVVAVLLPAASIGNVVSAREDRIAANTMDVEPRPGVEPLYDVQTSINVRGDYITVHYVSAAGSSSPVPPGLTDLPEPGELVVSPEVARILEGPAGESLRANLPGTVVGEIGKRGLVDAGDPIVYTGAALEKVRADEYVEVVYGFGTAAHDGTTTKIVTAAWVLPVATVLLLPLLIFVTTASRMGAAQRERRLAALRLIGLDARQVRRVAAAESLLGAVAGLAVGTGLFLLLRPLLSRIELGTIRLFPEDFVPPWPLALLIVVVVFALAVGASIFGLRRTIVEPLGVVRKGKPIRRRMWWRWTIVAVGALMMTVAVSSGSKDDQTATLLSVGVALLLIGVSVVLPWLVERLVARLRGGPPSWQLAIRRLQLDSGTPSRVVSGLVVVLAGAILIQGMLSSLQTMQRDEARQRPAGALPVQVSAEPEDLDQALRLIGTVPEAGRPRVLHRESLSSPDGQHYLSATIGDCAALSVVADLPSCSSGDVFVVERPGESTSGRMPRSLRFLEYTEDGSRMTGPAWTVPAVARPVPESAIDQVYGTDLFITRAALAGVGLPDYSVPSVYLGGDAPPQALLDSVARALQPLAWKASVRPGYTDTQLRDNSDEAVERVSDMLLAASIFVLAVAALSLLMLSIEQITERRRPLAALAATGVPRSVLLRGSLWQTGVPVAVGVVLAVAAGIGLSIPVLAMAEVPVHIGVGTVLVLALGAIAAVLVCTSLTWPLLRQATRLESLQAE
jgi:hypothetical protein